MDGVRRFVDDITQWVQSNPGTALVASNAVTAFAGFYIIAQREGGVGKALLGRLLEAAKFVPGVAGVVEGEILKEVKKVEQEFMKHGEGIPVIADLPEKESSVSDVLKILESYSQKERSKWDTGTVSGGLYHGGDELTALMEKSFGLFALSNPLHPDLFPATRKMEAEVVSWVLKLFNGGTEACGNMTSGGTESILMACKAAREHGRTTKGITEPEMVVPRTAHAAFDKACHYFGIKLVHVEVNQSTFTVDAAEVEKAITRNTVLVVGSAVNYPQGTVDDITALAALAKARDICMHVDCCLGSILIPFAQKYGKACPDFDFRVPGVTSISCDTHKFGYAPKGSSVVMFSSPAIRKHMYFVAPSWTGGIYASPTIAGSRAGALIASTWAVMYKLGYEGYDKAAKQIFDAHKVACDGVRQLQAEGKGIKLLGEAATSVVCIAADPDNGPSLNIYHVCDKMKELRGWNLNALQHPASFHLCITYANSVMIKEFLEDLRTAVEWVTGASAEELPGGTAGMYGLTGSLPDGPVQDVVKGVLDVFTRVIE